MTHNELARGIALSEVLVKIFRAQVISRLEDFDTVQVAPEVIEAIRSLKTTD